VADFNGDGWSDVIASDASYNRVHVMLATGSETFAPAVIVDGPEANNGTVGVDIADLDGDGDIDAAFSTWYPAAINILHNDGAGNFTVVDTFTTGPEPRDVAIGDFDGDGRPDIAAACQHYLGPLTDGTVAIHRNLDDAGWEWTTSITMPDGVEPYTYRAVPQFVEWSDVNDDGHLDLLTSSDSSNVLAIHLGDGSGGFTLGQTLGGWWLESGGSDILLADLDGDGNQDLVWGDVDMSKFAVYRNNLGTFEFHQSFASGNYGPLMLAAADFTNDGLIDIATTNNASRTFSIAVNLDGLNFDAALQLRPVEFPEDPILADFTGDGLTDLLLTHAPYLAPGHTMSVYPGLGNAVFDTASLDTPLDSVTSGILHARDINHDGNMDVVNLYGQCLVHMGRGDGTFDEPITSSLVVYLRHVLADFNLDGELDIAWLEGGHPSQIAVSFGDGTGHFGPATRYTDVAEDESIGVGDITGDGAPEIFTGHRYGIFSIHPNLGDGTFGPRRDITITGSPFTPSINAIAVADFDSDGDNDVVASAFGLLLFANPGDGNLPAVPVGASPASASILTPADINLDGHMDLYGRGASAIIYLNPGNGIFKDPMYLTRYDSNARSMVVADADNDGRADVMIGPENSWSQYLFLNRPPVSHNDNHNSTLDECEAPCVGDLTGDFLVNFDDLNVILEGFSTEYDFNDLNLVLEHWNQICN
ncbi:MAG: VCBS repeat-containing protein, partial [Phycisphaerales bacterium]|nr:VCBS repeat-containing protein [Phycisphaerales bacterium]